MITETPPLAPTARDACLLACLSKSVHPIPTLFPRLVQILRLRAHACTPCVLCTLPSRDQEGGENPCAAAHVISEPPGDAVDPSTPIL